MKKSTSSLRDCTSFSKTSQSLVFDALPLWEHAREQQLFVASSSKVCPPVPVLSAGRPRSCRDPFNRRRLASTRSRRGIVPYGLPYRSSCVQERMRYTDLTQNLPSINNIGTTSSRKAIRLKSMVLRRCSRRSLMTFFVFRAAKMRCFVSRGRGAPYVCN